MTYPSLQDTQILRSLVKQVMLAVPKKPGANETDVITFISLPMWKAFLHALHAPEDTVPLNWKDKPMNAKPSAVCSVYGSLTIVIPHKEMFAVSRARKPSDIDPEGDF